MDIADTNKTLTKVFTYTSNTFAMTACHLFKVDIEHFAWSIYRFVLDPKDKKTLLSWGKVIGSISEHQLRRDAPIEDLIPILIKTKAFIELMDPVAFKAFNVNMNKLYDVCSDTGVKYYPFICATPGFFGHQLLFAKDLPDRYSDPYFLTRFKENSPYICKEISENSDNRMIIDYNNISIEI